MMARNSVQRQAIHSGPARIMHYLAASTMTAVTPTVLLNLIVMRIGFLPVVGEHWNVILSTVVIVLAMVASTLFFLVLHAILEKPYLGQVSAVDRGWTEEDARTSGL